ncbi:hypothetical protein SAMN05216505_106119 [Streptomyces prasinopilosus]|uniref:Uncharacterized protein n=1 Tax=Streptomyces prasinopilosus TaxID=67344 RepID=A0A1G6TC77_9ACTN|nr:hypothetical protein SAMN05216505_106119 [Streptomyces prasinopilosus]
MRSGWAAAMLLLTSVLLLHLSPPVLGPDRHARPDRHTGARPMDAHPMDAHPTAEPPGVAAHPLVGRHRAAHSTSPVHPASVHHTVCTVVPAAPLPAAAPAPAPEAPDPRRAGESPPDLPDAAPHLRPARSPRTAKTAGAAPQGAADARADAVPPERSARDTHPPGISRSAEPAHGAGAPHAFRC